MCLHDHCTARLKFTCCIPVVWNCRYLTIQRITTDAINYALNVQEVQAFYGECGSCASIWHILAHGTFVLMGQDSRHVNASQMLSQASMMP